MNKNDINTDYGRWKFFDKVPLIPKDTQWKSYFEQKFADIDIDIDVDELKEVIEETVETSVTTSVDEAMGEKLDNKIGGVHRHIEDAKDDLSCKICCAKNNINHHIDEKFDEINFTEQFSNLNEQAEIIIQKLNNN